MYPQRLPIVNSDDGTWGNILVQYLQLQHFNDGTNNPVNGMHQNVSITAGTATAAPLTFTSGTLLTTAAAGAMEFNTDTLYFTITTGTVRKKVAIYDDSSGATGDLYYRNSSGAFVRLGVGNTNQFLGVTSGLPAWSSLTYPTATKTATTYTIGTSDCVIFANATSNNVTITIPLSSSCTGYQFVVKRIDSSANTCQVQTSGTDTIDGLTSISFDMQYKSMTMVSNGSAWYII